MWKKIIMEHVTKLVALNCLVFVYRPKQFQIFTTPRKIPFACVDLSMMNIIVAKEFVEENVERERAKNCL